MILVVNTGSTSLKYKVFGQDLEELKSGSFDGLAYPAYRAGRRQAGIGQRLHDHTQAVNAMLNELGQQKDEITKVGYRVVHGGDETEEVMSITLPVMKIIEKYSPLAPHHNPPAVKVIRALIEKIPYAAHFAVFDTAFFRNLPEVSKIYPIDKTIAEELGIKRYGFHGISHQWAASEVDPRNCKKVVTIHLGAGSSLAAIDCGKPIDTSMGFTPMEGVPMQTRSGDVDPEIILFLLDKLGSRRTREIIEDKSGLVGLSNTSGEMLTLLALAGEKVEDDSFHLSLDKTAKNSTKEEAELAIEIYCYRIKKYLGAYIAVLGGVDIVAFTGKIGYGSGVIRDKILKGLKFLDFQVKTVKPDEELAIAKKLC